MTFLYKYLLILWVLLLILPFNQTSADLAPNPITGGKSITPYSSEIDDVRMFEEDVQVRILKDEIETIADFYMVNEGETVSMEVGFPYGYPDEYIEFRAFVDDVEVDVRDSIVENTVRNKRITTYWKLWNMTFYRGRVCNIRVEYKAHCPERSDISLRRTRNWGLPREVLEDLDYFTTKGRVEYILWTGKKWKGTLDRCRITFRFEDRPLDRIKEYWPKDGKRTEYGVIWEYTDYEPKGWVGISYYPNMSIKDIAPYLYDIVKQYQDDPQVVSIIGQAIRKYYGGSGLQEKIYHDFITKWDGSIPDLLVREPDGGCRYNHGGDDHFYTMWIMAASLLRQYQKDGQLEKAKDIAPIVSKMSGAIIEALESCDKIKDSDRGCLQPVRTMYVLSLSLLEE